MKEPVSDVVEGEVRGIQSVRRARPALADSEYEGSHQTGSEDSL